MGEVEVKVKMIDGRELNVKLPPSAKISDLAECVLEQEDAPPNKIARLIHAGRILNSSDTVNNANITGVVHAVIGDHPSSLPAESEEREEDESVPQANTHRPPPSNPAYNASPAGNAASRQEFQERMDTFTLRAPIIILLGCCWYAYAYYWEAVYSPFSFLCLIALTALFWLIMGPALLDDLQFFSTELMRPAHPSDRMPEEDLSFAGIWERNHFKFAVMILVAAIVMGLSTA